MAQGLIAAALGGAGKALSSIGEMEAKKQNEAKLRKELMDMESEERLRLDEVMFQRKLERAIPEAETAAGAEAAGYKKRTDLGVPALAASYDVASQSAKLDATATANIPEKEAALASRRTKAQLDSDMKLGIPEAQAAYKVLQRIEELKAADLKNLSGEEAKAKYAALKADIDEAKRTKYWDSYYEQEANKKLTELEAILKAKVPAAQAKLAGETKLENLRVESEKEMIDAEADLLLKKWNAAKGQRDAAAIEKVQNEIKEFTTKAGDPKYRDAVRKLALAGYVRPSSGTKENEKVTTADLLRKLQAAEDDLAEALGVSDKKKINEEIRLLTEMANSKKNPDPEAKQKLKDIEQLRNNVKKRRDELQNWRDKSEEDKGGATSYKVGEERILSTGANKGKTVVWDGKQWNVKK